MSENIIEVDLFPIEGNHDCTGLGLNCPDPREKNPLPLYKCCGLICSFLRGQKDMKVFCAWDKNKSVDENMAEMRRLEENG